MRTALLLIVALASACSPCGRHASPDLEIGTGEESFVSLDDTGNAYTLVYGPQGGWHIPMGFSLRGLDASEIVTADMTGRINGSPLAVEEGRWVTLRCNTEIDRLQSWNQILEFDRDLEPSSCSLDQATIEIDIELTDWRGETLSDSVTATIDDPIHDEICSGDDT